MRNRKWRIIERMHERFVETVRLVLDADDDNDDDEHEDSDHDDDNDEEETRRFKYSRGSGSVVKRIRDAGTSSTP